MFDPSIPMIKKLVRQGGGTSTCLSEPALEVMKYVPIQPGHTTPALQDRPSPLLYTSTCLLAAVPGAHARVCRRVAPHLKYVIMSYR